MFGGNLTIDEFRLFNNNIKRQIQINIPPMVSIIHQVEETNLDLSNADKKNFIPLDDTRIKSADDNLRLKRSKPIASSQKYTLENCMRLKYV